MPTIRACGKEMTSNEFWGALNRRFDKRVKLLRSLGFKRHQEPGCPGAYVRERRVMRSMCYIDIGTIMYANNYVFREILNRETRS